MEQKADIFVDAILFSLLGSYAATSLPPNDSEWAEESLHSPTDEPFRTSTVVVRSTLGGRNAIPPPIFTAFLDRSPGTDGPPHLFHEIPKYSPIQA